MHCKFPIFINGAIAPHVSGSFSAHHQECCQPYGSFGTVSCSLVTDCCQDQDGTSVLIVTAVGHRAAWNCTKAAVRLITLLMMGRKTAQNMWSYCAINKNWKFTVHLLVSFISNLRDARSYNPKVTRRKVEVFRNLNNSQCNLAKTSAAEVQNM